ncbi:hypothetical protein GCM10027598_03180 [Amycolatopsis oliviviridis]|uniref:Secreted protein n=1 Tax=Amycolatopsis oliviviridis TaxID=1471590 RepID=A0ABQ3LUQ0_9PSEU|nr:hypothetical protein GCM10017790_36570 [Amycolatopsis oliviviridis]
MLLVLVLIVVTVVVAAVRGAVVLVMRDEVRFVLRRDRWPLRTSRWRLLLLGRPLPLPWRLPWTLRTGTLSLPVARRRSSGGAAGRSGRALRTTGGVRVLTWPSAVGIVVHWDVLRTFRG